MDRRQALTALAIGVPGLATAANRPIQWGDARALGYKEPRYTAIFRPDGCIEIPLDGWSGWRISYNGETIDITPAEIMDALRDAARGGGA